MSSLVTSVATALGACTLLTMAPNPAQDAPRTTLSQQVGAMHWDAEKKGSLLYIDPDLSAPHDASGLAAFDRHMACCGGINVIVPTEMVLIDASLSDQANLFEGLSRSDKIVYLMSTLTEGQWRKANTKGITLADLQGDQRAALASILPKSFKYDCYQVNPDGSLKGQGLDGEVGSDDISQVGIRFYRSLYLMVRMLNANGYTAAINDSSGKHSPGDTVIYRELGANESRTSLFGVTIRSIAPNGQKPSDLNYRDSGLDTIVDVPKTATVGQLVAMTSHAVNTPIVVDCRAAQRKVVFLGEHARAGDLLQAIALALTATYRRIGNTYDLTSDLAGIGERRARIAFWYDEAKTAAEERRDRWFRESGAKDGYEDMAYAAGDKNVPNDAIKQWISAKDVRGESDGLSLSELPSNLQDQLNAFATKVSDSQPVRIDHVIPGEQVFWNYVLPDGRQLETEGSLGSAEFFANHGYDWKSERPIPISPIDVSGKHASLVLRVADKEGAIGAVDSAVRHGFTKVWLQTTRSDCLDIAIAEAKRSGISVGLLVRPWESMPGQLVKDPDKTILGETAVQASIRRLTSLRAEEQFERPRIPLMPAFPTLGPTDPALSAQWNLISKLAGEAGVDEVSLCDTEPPGYELKLEQNGSGIYDRSMAVAGDLGYPRAMREQFLVQNGVDPIDIENETLLPSSNPEGSVDLTLPFFAADRAAADDLTKRWAAFCSESCAFQIKRLANQIGKPMLIEGARISRDGEPEGAVLLSSWSPGQDLPTYLGPGDRNLIGAGSALMVHLGYPMSPRVAGSVWQDLVGKVQSSPQPVMIDMTAYPPVEWKKTLDLWFVKK